MLINLAIISFFLFGLYALSKIFGTKNIDLNQEQNEMVKCSICKTYVVGNTAKKINEEWFCSKPDCN